MVSYAGQNTHMLRYLASYVADGINRLHEDDFTLSR